MTACASVPVWITLPIISRLMPGLKQVSSSAW
jgi:hypothetical protein